MTTLVYNGRSGFSIGANMTERKPRLMIVDGNNNYLRAFIVNPTISTNGDPIGGITGTIKILQKLAREMQPDRIVVCWDGAGGSQKRKAVVKEYKDGRSPLRLNRNIDNLTDNEKLRNQVWQMLRLMDYLNDLPIIQLMFDGVEADDLIASVARHQTQTDYNKIIVSNDKDFLQLCSDDTILYRPVKDQYVSTKNVIDEYGIHPNNFALARAVAGDKSDNLVGVEGVGLKTLIKNVPILSESTFVTINDLMDYCSKIEKNCKAVTSILNSRDVIEKNYSIMQLYSPSLSIQTSQKVTYALENTECNFNKTEFLKKMNKDGWDDFNTSDLFLVCKNIMKNNCQESS